MVTGVIVVVVVVGVVVVVVGVVVVVVVVVVVGVVVVGVVVVVVVSSMGTPSSSGKPQAINVGLNSTHFKPSQHSDDDVQRFQRAVQFELSSTGKKNALQLNSQFIWLALQNSSTKHSPKLIVQQNSIPSAFVGMVVVVEFVGNESVTLSLSSMVIPSMPLIPH